MVPNDQPTVLRASRAQERRLNAILKGLILDPSDRIIAGPWTGEVGFEVMYWIPLLRWCVERWPKLQDRLVVVSRGGVAGWYEGIADTYVDIGEFYDAESFARRLEKERERRRAGELSEDKQLDESDWDREIAKQVGRKLGTRRPPMLHPSIAYRAKKIVWSIAKSDGFVPWRRPERGPLAAHLPAEYVAVRFYWNAFFERYGKRFAEEATRALSKQIPVVLLDPGMQLDASHPDFGSGVEAIRLAPHVQSFKENLELQSIAIANAKAFVGSAGGLSYVAPHYGVPSICFWSIPGQWEGKGIWGDLGLAERAFTGLGWGPYIARSCHTAPIEQLLAPVFSPSSGSRPDSP